MANTFASFDKRLSKIDRKNRKLARGYKTRVEANGLIRARPTRSFHFPLRGALLLVAGFFLFKAFMLASVGPGAYIDRLALLESGTIVESAGSWVLQIDPLTQYLASQMGPVFR